MRKSLIAAIIAACLVTAGVADDASAQHYHGYHRYEHDDYGAIAGHHHGGYHGYRGHDHHGHHAHHHDHYDYAPRVLRYNDVPALDVYSVPLGGSTFDEGHGDLEVYCPNASACPLDDQSPAVLAPRFQQTTPYAGLPRARLPNKPGIPNDNARSGDHSGHDHSGHSHGAHSHDSHSHGDSLPPLGPNQFAPNRDTVTLPDQQPMTPPSLPSTGERNRSPGPPRRESSPSGSTSKGGSIRIDQPPPRSFSVAS